MKQHAFNQAEIFMLERRIGQNFKDAMFDRFSSIAKEFGFKVRVTGGNFLTHEINGNSEDFTAICELAKQLS